MKNKTRRSVYTTNDYNSNDGMLTAVWGPGMWHFLHVMSFNYPTSPSHEDQEHYRDFILNLQYTLPCKFCRINLIKNLKRMPLTDKVMSSRDTFSRYVYNLHELVNNLLKKKSNLTYEQVKERYEHFRARCTTEIPKIKKVPKKNKTLKKEKGCTEPLYGKKAKCVLKIVPFDTKVSSFQMDKKCIKKRI
jgi:hypothetical protein